MQLLSFSALRDQGLYSGILGEKATGLEFWI